MSIAALVTWIITALIGSFMLIRWVSRGGLRRQGAAATHFPPARVYGVYQPLHQSGDGLFGGGHLAEYLTLARRIGDVTSGLEPPQHRPHVVDHRADLADHRGDRVHDARRHAAHP